MSTMDAEDKIAFDELSCILNDLFEEIWLNFSSSFSFSYFSFHHHFTSYRAKNNLITLDISVCLWIKMYRFRKKNFNKILHSLHTHSKEKRIFFGLFAFVVEVRKQNREKQRWRKGIIEDVNVLSRLNTRNIQLNACMLARICGIVWWCVVVACL